MDDQTIRSETETALRGFFDEFLVAFATFNGAEIAARYHEPYLAFHVDGSADVLLTRAETADYFQRIVDGYHAAGCRSCRYLQLNFLALGSSAILGTVTWELLDVDGKVLAAWRESYNLHRDDSKLKVFASTDHAGIS